MKNFIISVVFTVFLYSCAKVDPPSAFFTISPENPQAGESITLIDQSTGNIDSWTWDFGNGSGATYNGQSENPIMTFPEGQFTISLTVENEGGSDSYEKIINIGPTISLGSFTDSRDGQSYQTVSYGNTTWMAENLNYSMGNSWCYDDDPMNCNTYGRLYDWNTAETACPSGWHLPSHAEWWSLISSLGGVSEAGRKMKTASGWDTSPSNYVGDNSSGFSGLPSGYRELGGTYWYAGKNTTWWSSTLAYVQASTYYYYHTVSLNYNVQEVNIDDPSVGMGQNSTQKAESRVGLPCRCIKD